MSTDGSGFSADRLSVALELLSWDVEWRRPDRDLDRFWDLDLLSFRRITGDLDRVLLDLLRRDPEPDRRRRPAEWGLDLDCDLRLPSRSVALFCLGILWSLFLSGNGSWHRPL